MTGEDDLDGVAVPSGTAPAEFYTDDVRVRAGVFGFALEFGLNVATEAEDVQLVRPVARAYMSPQLAKALAQILGTQVERYEAQVGEIPLPGAPATTRRSTGRPRKS